MYTKTWLYTLATAALTGLGTLAILHRWFVELAVAAYVLPPIVLYLVRSPEDGAVGETVSDASVVGDVSPGGNEVDASTADEPTGATLFDVTVADTDAYPAGDGGTSTKRAPLSDEFL